MNDDFDKSLGDAATFAGQSHRRPSTEMSLGDERTLGGDSAAGVDTTLGDIEVVDLDARYKPEGTLGQGGMGAVVLATDTRLGRKVAIKRILGEAAGNRMAVQRFLTEAKSIAALNHPNVVQIYDYGRAKDGPFLIMEYVDGGSLLERCRESALPLEEAIDLACHVCDGLAKAHDLGIVHRDIKPANVLLTKDGVPKLTDFGLAKAESGDHGQTMTGAVLGTPDFMPPEQRRDAAEVDPRSDLWSLAATIYQMVTGRSPKIIRFNDIPAALQDVLGKALEDRKDARYQTARELRDALKNARGNQTAAASKAPVFSAVGDELREGQCSVCGTVTTDLTKKFCRNAKCGASLRVACLKCEAQIPVWDGVCGECGGNLPALIEARRQYLLAEQRKAEELAAAFAFDEAIAVAQRLAAESRSEFAAFATWAKGFIESTTKEQDQLRASVSRSLADAQRHATACDYPAAIHAIETIPERLRDGPADFLLKQCRSCHDEAERLLADIAGRVKRKELSGLLPLVERAAVLRQDRQDLAKILGQLRERRDGAVTRAREALAAGDAKRALAAFGGMTEAELAGDDRTLFERVQRATLLEARLAENVAAAKADGVVTPDEAADLFAACVEYLQINPANESVRTLASQCRGKAGVVLAKRERERVLALPPLVNSIGIELKLIPAGPFTMGQRGGGSDETPHAVTLSRPYYLGVYEVTNAHWKAVMGSVPSNWREADRPVEQVSWEDAVEFCRKLSALPAERQAGRVYRLPTEAEWEYACRAGTKTEYSFGDEESRLGEYAWYDGNSGSKTHPVGRKKPNAWGLFDMHGNVWEWCSDRYGAYPEGAGTDPQGPSRGSDRVFRGGSWSDAARYCRAAYRGGLVPSFRNDFLGFRLALSPSGSSPPEAAEK